MNASQLWDTTINPETRRLMQVRIEDVVAADDIFTTLMGDAVEPRREFIEKSARQVSSLDIETSGSPRWFEMTELGRAAALVGRAMPPTPQYAWPKLKV